MFDWSHIFTAAATTGTIVLLRTLFMTLVREPARALMNNYTFIKFLSGLWFKHGIYSGQWLILWTVKSENFPDENRDNANIFKFLHYIAVEIEIETTEGTKIKYGFVGKIYDSVITGEWFDIRGPKAGYYGPFQIVLTGTMTEARGKWVGFAQDRTVKSGDLRWTKIEE